MRKPDIAKYVKCCFTELLTYEIGNAAQVAYYGVFTTRLRRNAHFGAVTNVRSLRLIIQLL